MILGKSSIWFYAYVSERSHVGKFKISYDNRKGYRAKIFKTPSTLKMHNTFQESYTWFVMRGPFTKMD